ncbi:MAG: 6-carboxytetrahydropterin synthase, partial [Candidatus Coatesbacteria bacterium]
HTDLSENEFLQGRNATAENLAELIYKALAARFADAPAEVRSVTVYESARYGATYHE